MNVDDLAAFADTLHRFELVHNEAGWLITAWATPTSNYVVAQRATLTETLTLIQERLALLKG